MYEPRANLKSCDLEDDGLPPIMSIADAFQEIIEQYGSFEAWEIAIGEQYATEFKRAIENHYSRAKIENTPVYVFESLDGYHAINCDIRGDRMPKPSFLLDDGFLLPYLKNHPDFLTKGNSWMPIGYEPSPVILVYDFLNDARVIEFMEILERAKITYFIQDVDHVQDLIFESDLEVIRESIKNQESPDYERIEPKERMFSLWMD